MVGILLRDLKHLKIISGVKYQFIILINSQYFVSDIY